ncbi:MAG: hypothetical protein GTN93_26495 [Anaerolineae bacterium]|nr:hypothetical protein [Anaerolineae bacterium]
MAQFARPNSDITKGSWSPSSGTDLYPMLDEETQDGDSTYIESLTAVDTFEVGLSDVTDPGVGTGHVLHFWFRTSGSGGPEKVDIQLRENTTTIVDLQNQANRSGSYIDVNYTLSEAEANSITDYTALAIRALNENAADPEFARVTMCCLEVPDAGGPIDETGKLVTVLAAISKSDTMDMYESGKLLTGLAVLSNSDACTRGEKGKSSIGLVTLSSSDSLVANEKGLQVTPLAVLASTDVMSAKESGLATAAVVVNGSDARLCAEGGKSCLPLAIVSGSDGYIYGEGGKQALVLCALSASDSQKMVEAGDEAVLVIVTGHDTYIPVGGSLETLLDTWGWLSCGNK